MKDKGAKKAATREKLFATLAKKEGQGAAKRAKIEKAKGQTVAAADSKREALLDNLWAKKRARWSKQEAAKE